jgi:hypothetical protein
MRTLALAALVLAFSACGSRHSGARSPYRPIGEVESLYGPMVAAANHPTPDQHGTGEPVGLFRDATGTVWGLALAINGDLVSACAPSSLRDARITGDIDAESTIVGSANEPTGWRGGTGDINLLMRDRSGRLYPQIVYGGELPGESTCWAQEVPGPRQRLNYYRLVPRRSGR